jgi:Fungal specific transcription factor domain
MGPRDQDLISKGIISLEDAKLYFDHYTERLDHFVYRILGSGNTVTFEDTRRSSPLLIAAICTVGALHFTTRERDFDLCRNEFVTLCEKRSLSQDNDIADVRALCIGAFWLPDLSWPLSTAAVRIATELQLHKSFYKSTHDDCYQQYTRTRLYYHVYACDHHASIPFGRPPLTRECEAIRDCRKFLSVESATEDDARLVSQVCRWSVLSNIYDAFGVDVGRHLTDIEVPSLRKFNLALDNLRAEWVDRFIPSAHVGNYPRKGVGLQYHFAKLYLCSHAFRGTGSHGDKGPPSRSPDLAMELDDIANIAVLSGLSILRSVLADLETQSFLDGLPTYFHVMVTFAVVFLLKVSTKPSYSIHLDAKEVKRLIGETVTTLNRLTSNMHPRHLLVSIAKGLENLLQQSGSSEPRNSASSAPDIFPRASEIDCWNDGTFDPYFLGTYDFYTDQSASTGFDATLENMVLLQ